MRPRNPKSRGKKSQVRGSSADATPRRFEHAGPPQLIHIEKPIYGGAFLGRLDGKAVFVPLALPGERARVRIVDEKRGYATAEAEEILSAAPERVSAPCPYFGSCGGCQYQHADYAAQLRFKQVILRETLERASVHTPEVIEVLAGEPWAYRNRIRLAFDARGNPGYRGRRSHHIIPVAECPIAASVLVKAASEFAELARALAPDLRPTEIALFCNREETAIQASISAAPPGKPRLDDLARAMQERIPALAGLEIIIEGQHGQPPRTVARWGETGLDYRAADFDYRVNHGAFFQVNRWLVDALVECVATSRRGALAWDLFAGVGLFARRLTASFDRVIAVESSSASTAALAHNLQGTSASVVAASTFDFLRGNRRGHSADLVAPDLIVVDPPRTGLGPDTTSFLAEIAAPALTYVSCDPATLARDLSALIAAGYSLESLTLADLFPQTFHLETIAKLHMPSHL